jgi:hypothetical protein
MTATTAPTAITTSAPKDPARAATWKAGLAAAAIAGAANTGVVAAARALDVAVAIDGERIPLLGFPQMTVLFSVVGILIARSLAKRSSRSRSRFVQTTVLLTALSFVPDLTASTGTADKLTLMLTHVVAAAIVIPAIAGKLASSRR